MQTTLMIDVEGDDPQTQAGKSAAKPMDALYGPAVLGRFADEGMEVFLSSNPFADWRSQVHGQPDGRYLSVDSDIFPTTPFIKWDAHTLLPSVEYKARLAAGRGNLLL